MALNLGHLAKFQGILKIVGLVLALIAASLGTSAFRNSPYNQSCRDNEIFPPNKNVTTTAIPVTGSDLTTTLRTRTTTSPPPVGKSGRQGTGTSAPPGSSSVDPTGITGSTEATTTEDPNKDMAPVLWMERFQISVSWICLIVSAILLVMCILKDDLEYRKCFKAINFGFHFTACIFLIVSAIFMAFAAIEIDRQICREEYFENKEDCQAFKQKMSAAAFSILLAIVYAVLSFKIIATKLYEQV